MGQTRGLILLVLIGMNVNQTGWRDDRLRARLPTTNNPEHEKQKKKCTHNKVKPVVSTERLFIFV